MKGLFLGTVTSFKKQRGFGQIKPDNKSKFGDKISCHWKSIKSSDKWPYLVDGMRVAFKAEKKGNAWKTTEVYSKDGKEISMKNELVLLENGEQYRGECTSWNKSKGEGVIKPHEDGPWGKKGLKVLRSDIDSDGTTASLKKGQQVQFQVAKEGKLYRAVNIILPGSGKKAKGDKSKTKAKDEPKESTKKKVVTKRAQKRKLPEEDKDTSAQKKVNIGGKQQMKPAQLESGVYGNMEVSVEDVIEVGILLKSQWVGSLIGKKGTTIKEIRKLSGAEMQFGNDEIQIENGSYKVFAISGNMNQVADACKVVAVKLGEAAQSLEYRIVFLVPDAYCGMFVGKKGSTIKEIRGDLDLRVRVILSQDPITLPGSSLVTVCTVFGPRENVKDAIERTVAVLGGISARIRKEMTEPQPPQWEDQRGGFRGGIQDMGWGQGGRVETVDRRFGGRGGPDWGQPSRGFGGRY